MRRGGDTEGDLYRFESALSHANKANAPFLIMHGTADPTVAFSNGLGFHNALRFQFFDHHLKGAPAPT